MKFVEIAPTSAESSATYVDVTGARVVAPYTLAIVFSDGAERMVDFGPFLLKSRHPVVRAYLNEDRFREFDIVGGNLNWHDYDLIFPLADLYAGRIS